MFEAFFASIVLAFGIAASPAAASPSDVPILANRLVVTENGLPVEMLFDPAAYGSGLQLATGASREWIPSTCEFGKRDAKHADASVTQLIHAARDKAEAATGRQVDRVTYCKLELKAIFQFKTDAGMMRMPWRSLWGEKRTFRMWYSVDDDTILLFSFVGDA